MLNCAWAHPYRAPDSPRTVLLEPSRNVPAHTLQSSLPSALACHSSSSTALPQQTPRDVVSSDRWPDPRPFTASISRRLPKGLAVGYPDKARCAPLERRLRQNIYMYTNTGDPAGRPPPAAAATVALPKRRSRGIRLEGLLGEPPARKVFHPAPPVLDVDVQVDAAPLVRATRHRAQIDGRRRRARRTRGDRPRS